MNFKTIASRNLGDMARKALREEFQHDKDVISKGMNDDSVFYEETVADIFLSQIVNKYPKVGGGITLDGRQAVNK